MKREVCSFNIYSCKAFSYFFGVLRFYKLSKVLVATRQANEVRFESSAIAKKKKIFSKTTEIIIVISA
jgi:hypothetical protein